MGLLNIYGVPASKIIGTNDEISFGICFSDVVCDVAVYDSLGDLVKFGLVASVCGALATCLYCRMADGFYDCCAVGADSAKIDSKNRTEMVTL